MSLNPDSHPFVLLKFLGKEPNRWYYAATEIYGVVFPKNLRYGSSKLFERELIDKVMVDGKAKIKINEKGRKLLASIESPKIDQKKGTSPKKEATNEPTKIGEFGIGDKLDLYTLRKTVSSLQRDLLTSMLYARAFDTAVALSVGVLREKVDSTAGTIEASLRELMRNQLLICTIHQTYYLTSDGIKLAESFTLKGLEFAEDSLEAYLFNPLGRKVLHFIAVGKTVNQIAEEVGYLTDDIILKPNDVWKEMNYCISKVFQLLDRLAQTGIISLQYHAINGSCKVSEANKLQLDLLQRVAMLVEFIPTIFIRDAQCQSILQNILPKQQEITGLFDEVDAVPVDLRGKISYLERVAYWLEPIEAYEEKAKQWKKIALVKHNGKHFLMVKKDEKHD